MSVKYVNGNFSLQTIVLVKGKFWLGSDTGGKVMWAHLNLGNHLLVTMNNYPILYDSPVCYVYLALD